jgi:hypothetical protein
MYLIPFGKVYLGITLPDIKLIPFAIYRFITEWINQNMHGGRLVNVLYLTNINSYKYLCEEVHDFNIRLT